MTMTAGFHHSPLQTPILHALARNWWLVLLRGLAAIAFGVLAFAWPGLTLLTLVLLYGAYALIDGVVALGTALTGGAERIATWWLILVGIAGIAAGILTFVWPGGAALVLTLFVGAWAIVHGVGEIMGAIQLRKEIDNEWLLILAGALSVLFGAFVMIAPAAGALSLVWMIGAYAILFGALLVGLSLRLRRYAHD